MVSEPPSWCTDGKGGAWEGLYQLRQGALWAGQVHGGCEQARIWAARFRSAGPGGGPRSGLSTRSLCGQRQAAQRKGLILHSCSAGLFPGQLSVEETTNSSPNSFV